MPKTSASSCAASGGAPSILASSRPAASSQVPGPANDAAAVCSASSVQSTSPEPVRGRRHDFAEAHVLHKPGYPTGSGMVGFGKQFRKGKSG
ncbi:MAG TPA: hypothetical protein VF940_34030 [Streptosporangiaceae bacterium]